MNSLDENAANLSKNLPVLNFLSPPARGADMQEHNSLNMEATTAEREYQLGQTQQHTQPKSLDSFIKGRQRNLSDFLALLANLIVNFWFCVERHNTAPNELLIIHFLRKMVSIIARPSSASGARNMNPPALGSPTSARSSPIQ